ncbi:MAG: GNAT family N-acetyltransferase [Betaproteobacteria bacterium]
MNLLKGNTKGEPLLETERLVLRRYTKDDLDRLDGLNSDAEVMRYIGDGSLRSREQTQAGIVRAQRIYDYFPGLGFWIAEQKPRGNFVGVFALIYIPDTVEVEVGYRLHQSAWGKGLATEGAGALVKYGFNTVGLERIVGLTHPENDASKNVLMKSGLAPRGMGHYYGKELCYFVAEKTTSSPAPGTRPTRTARRT